MAANTICRPCTLGRHIRGMCRPSGECAGGPNVCKCQPWSIPGLGKELPFWEGVGAPPRAYRGRGAAGRQVHARNFPKGRYLSHDISCASLDESPGYITAYLSREISDISIPHYGLHDPVGRYGGVIYHRHEIELVRESRTVGRVRDRGSVRHLYSAMVMGLKGNMTVTWHLPGRWRREGLSRHSTSLMYI
jgi:hypothetical protein